MTGIRIDRAGASNGHDAPADIRRRLSSPKSLPQQFYAPEGKGEVDGAGAPRADAGYAVGSGRSARRPAGRLQRTERDEYFESEPDAFVALRESVERLVEAEDSAHAAEAKEHADELQRQIQAQIDQE